MNLTNLATNLTKAVAYLLCGIEQAANDASQEYFDQAGQICKELGFSADRHVWTFAFLAAHLQLIGFFSKLVAPQQVTATFDLESTGVPEADKALGRMLSAYSNDKVNGVAGRD